MTRYIRMEYQEICQMGGGDKAVVFKLVMSNLEAEDHGKQSGVTICWGLFPTSETGGKIRLFGGTHYT